MYWDIIKILTNEGQTIKEICKYLQCSRSSVLRIRAKLKKGLKRYSTNNSEPIQKRLGLNNSQYEQYLKALYHDEGLSQKLIADRLKVHITTIESHFKKYNINLRQSRNICPANQKHANMSDREYEVLDGILLGDGHLACSSVAARLSYSCEFEQVVDDLRKDLPSLKFSAWQGKIKSKPPGSSEYKSYIANRFKSHSYVDLLSERRRWYPNGIKVVPEDIRITKTSCYWWFIGDGYQIDYGLILCTDSFSNSDISILRSKLLDLGYDTKLNNRNRIKIKGQGVHKFLKWTRSAVNKLPKHYSYKWGNHRRQCVERR